MGKPSGLTRGLMVGVMTVTRDCPDCGDSLIKNAEDSFSCIQCGSSLTGDDIPPYTGSPLDISTEPVGVVRMYIPDKRRHHDTTPFRMGPDAARALAEALEVAADNAERREPGGER